MTNPKIIYITIGEDQRQTEVLFGGNNTREFCQKKVKKNKKNKSDFGKYFFGEKKFKQFNLNSTVIMMAQHIKMMIPHHQSTHGYI